VNNTEHLARLHCCADTIRTSLGGIVRGSAAFAGVDVLGELSAFTQTEAFLLWALGRKPLPPETRLVDTLICINTYPDIRIWSIRAAAYAAAAGAPLSACFTAAQAAANGTIFGVGPLVACARFLRMLHKKCGTHKPEAVIEGLFSKKTFLPGFGRPLIQGPDERIGRLLQILKDESYCYGPHVRLLLAIAEKAKTRKNLHPNFAGLFAALLIDPPFDFDLTKITVMAHYAVTLASYLPACEIHDRPLGEPLLPLKVSDISYSGKPRRTMEKKA